MATFWPYGNCLRCGLAHLSGGVLAAGGGGIAGAGAKFVGMRRAAIAVGLEGAELEKLVMEQEFVQRNLGGAPVKKFIFVQNRIINIVI